MARRVAISLPSSGKVGKNWSTPSKTTVRSKRVGPLDHTVISFNNFNVFAEKILARKIVYYDFHSLLCNCFRDFFYFRRPLQF